MSAVSKHEVSEKCRIDERRCYRCNGKILPIVIRTMGNWLITKSFGKIESQASSSMQMSPHNQSNNGSNTYKVTELV